MKYPGMMVVIVLLLAACNYQPITAPADQGEIEAQAGFVDIGGVLDITPTNRASTSSLVLDKNGKPVVVWQEGINNSSVLYLKTWNGSSWVQRTVPIGTPPFALNDLSPESLAIDTSNNPVVAVKTTGAEFAGLEVDRWDGTKWLKLPFQLSASNFIVNNVVTVSMAVDKANKPLVAFTANAQGEEGLFGTFQNLVVARWDGTKLAQLGKQVEGFSASSLDGSKLGIPLDVSSLSLATDNLDRPVVAVARCAVAQLPCINNLYVKRWDGSKWVQLGNSLTRSNSKGSSKPSLAVDKNGNLFVAFIESVTGGVNLYVKKWTGSTWVQLDSNVDSAGSGVNNPSLALTPDGRPMVAYDESYNGNRNIYIKVLSYGGTWGYVGAKVERTITNNAYLPSLAVDGAGNAIFSYEEEVAGQLRNVYVRRFQPDVPKQWVQLGGIVLDNAGVNSVRIDSSNQPIVATVRQEAFESGVAPFINIRRWNGTTWTTVGQRLQSGFSSGNPISFAIDKTNNPIVAALGSDLESGLFVQRWNGSSWSRFGANILNGLSLDYGSVFLQLDKNDYPVVAWHESSIFSSVPSYSYVKRWNGQIWEQLGGKINNPGNEGAFITSLALTKSSDVPVVGLSECVVLKNEFGEDYCGATSLYVKRWNGSQWLQLGGKLDSDISVFDAGPIVQVDATGNPIAAWTEGVRSGSISTVSFLVKRWDGTKWVQLGEPVATASSQYAYGFIASMALDANSNPIVAWHNCNTNTTFVNSCVANVSAWVNSQWRQLGQPLNLGNPNIDSYGVLGASSIAVSLMGDVVAAWNQCLQRDEFGACIGGTGRVKRYQ
jgi:hypothetical protein